MKATRRNRTLLSDCGRRFAGAAVILLLVGSPSASRAQSVDVAAIEKLIIRAMEDKRFVGLSAAVMSEGRVVLTKGYGVRSLATRDPVTPETMFAVASLTKQFTCAGVMLLAQEKKLSIDDKVAKYFPGLTRANDISLLDLGNHVAGYRDYYPLDFVDRAMAVPRPTTSVIQDFATRPLDFEPGTRWSYSNTGYLILGEVIERVSGEPLDRFLERRLLSPLGLRHTRYDTRRDQPGQASAYTPFALTPPDLSVPEAQGWLGGAAGLWSTPSDLLEWDLALIDGKVVSPASYRLMTTPRRLSDGRTTGYGCGLEIRDRGPAVVLSHGGWLSGFNARNTFVPATRSGIVLLANTDSAFPALEALSDAILPMLLPPPANVPAVSGPSALHAAVTLMRQMQTGSLNRGQVGAEFNAFLTPERLKAVSAPLALLGEPKTVEVVDLGERGGMELATVRFTFGAEVIVAWMYRTADGLIQEFWLFRQ